MIHISPRQLGQIVRRATSAAAHIFYAFRIGVATRTVGEKWLANFGKTPQWQSGSQFGPGTNTGNCCLQRDFGAGATLDADVAPLMSDFPGEHHFSFSIIPVTRAQGWTPNLTRRNGGKVAIRGCVASNLRLWRWRNFSASGIARQQSNGAPE
jgi:hypothetical protein